MEEETRRLRGRVDEADNRDRRLAADLQKLTEDMEYRLQRIEGSSAPAAAAARPATPAAPVAPVAPPAVVARPAAPTAPAAPVVPPPAASAAPRTAERAISDGQAALARRDYAAAEAAAREVIATPRSPRVYDAQFLLAQALNGKKDYQGAAVAFDDSYNRARTGPKAQDSLLGLANALTLIGAKPAACATLDKLKAEFATPRADLKDPIAGARQRAACR
jgi:TolA-binding protein